jgi:hypothetical protein
MVVDDSCLVDRHHTLSYFYRTLKEYHCNEEHAELSRRTGGLEAHANEHRRL